MTLERYEEMLAEQGGGCAICRRPPGRTRLHVDHDHRCCPGKKSCGECVRGLLCWYCNRSLAVLENDSEIYRRMRDYAGVEVRQIELQR